MKIAVFLPHRYRGGTLRVAKTLAKVIASGSSELGKPANVVFAHLPWEKYQKEDFADLVAQGIQLREFEFQDITARQMRTASELIGVAANFRSDLYSVPNDSGYDFLDCDVWIFATDRIPHPVAPLKPYFVFVQDYLQRYVKYVFSDYYEEPIIAQARGAAGVLVSTPHTRQDALHYAGIPSKRVHLVPMVMDFDNVPKTRNTATSDSDYFIWSTNLGPHKNHRQTLDALANYYSTGGKLRCVVTGVDSEQLSPDCKDETFRTIQDYRKLIASHSLLRAQMKFTGEQPEAKYRKLLAGARFILHNAVADNGTFTVIEAAYAGTPALSADYPPMRYIDERFLLNCKFFDPDGVPAKLTKALFEMEKEAGDIALRLPKQSELKTHDWVSQGAKFLGAVPMLRSMIMNHVS